MVEGSELRLSVPGLTTIIGPTCCGKSVLVKEMLLNKRDIFNVPIHSTIYVYAFWQKNYDDLRQSLGPEGISFVEGGGTEDLFAHPALVGRNDESPAAVLVFDDVLETLLRTRESLQIFTANLHHLNLCCE